MRSTKRRASAFELPAAEGRAVSPRVVTARSSSSRSFSRASIRRSISRRCSRRIESSRKPLRDGRRRPAAGAPQSSAGDRRRDRGRPGGAAAGRSSAEAGRFIVFRALNAAARRRRASTSFSSAACRAPKVRSPPGADQRFSISHLRADAADPTSIAAGTRAARRSPSGARASPIPSTLPDSTSRWCESSPSSPACGRAWLGTSSRSQGRSKGRTRYKVSLGQTLKRHVRPDARAAA